MYILIYRSVHPGRPRQGCSTRPANNAGDKRWEDTRAHTHRRSILLAALLAAALATLTAPATAQAQTWPSGTIRIVVPYPPAGSTDVIARLVQPACSSGSVRPSSSRTAPGHREASALPWSPSRRPTATPGCIVFDNHAANPFVLPSMPYDTEKDLDPVLFIGHARPT